MAFWIDAAKRASQAGLGLGYVLGCAAYFAAMSLGAIGWMALLGAPWLDFGSISKGTLAALFHGWLPWMAMLWGLGWAGAVARSIGRSCRPAGGLGLREPDAFAAWCVLRWLGWLDASLALSRGVGQKAPGRFGVLSALIDLPFRSMACCLGIALVVGLPVVLHLAVAFAFPFMLVDLLLPQGPGIGLLERVKKAAVEASSMSREEMADKERAEISKEIAQSKADKEKSMWSLGAKKAQEAIDEQARQEADTEMGQSQKSASSSKRL